jgi:tetratricopeptide (TPR) repeat protein
MITISNRKNHLETTFFEGVDLVSLLLRLGHYPEAINLASQLLLYFPQALPLHVGLGRALLLLDQKQSTDETVQRAIAHLRRVLDSDPENWRVRLEVAMLYFRGDTASQERAGQEVWVSLQTAPQTRWLRERIETLPDYPVFSRARQWISSLATTPDELLPENRDDGGKARLFLQRKMPWMAVSYLENATRRVQPDVPRADLKTGLLLALWMNGESKRASDLASEMLREQPQLILPRLLLTHYLSTTLWSNKPEALIHLMETVWQLDPFLERSTELLNSAGLTVPPLLWPRPHLLNHSGPPSALAQWQRLGFTRPLKLKLAGLDGEWLKTLLVAGQDWQRGNNPELNPRHELSFSLEGLEQPIVETESRLLRERDRINRKALAELMSDNELEKIISSLGGLETSVYGKSPVSATVSPPTASPSNATGPAQPKAGAGRGSPPVAAGSRPTTYKISAATLTGDDPGGQPLRQPIALLVSSEKALSQKYGAGGFHQIKAVLDQLTEAMTERGLEARLLLVDSSEGLRQSGFTRLSPVNAHEAAQVHSLINAALPEDNNYSPALPDTVFIIGGPDIIPFWKLPNPSFDSDREVLSDNPYGSRYQTYLLPERVVGRMPDAAGPDRDRNLNFFLNCLKQAVNRQRHKLVSHALTPNLPLRVMETILPARVRQGLMALDQSAHFEEKWLRQTLETSEPLLDKALLNQLMPFFYSAEAWKDSTETLRKVMGAGSRPLVSPPVHAGQFDRSLLQQSRLLHFNLHGFVDTPNWYGQSELTRIIATPSLASLPVAFNPALAREIQTPGAVVFSEACYGGHLNGKGLDDSIALTTLAQGAQAFIGSTVISYGSIGPELSCADHLAYYFWREVLQQGSSFGRAMQLARINYARERLSAGHDLSADDAKTLLEFVVYGDPTLSLGRLPSSLPLEQLEKGRARNVSKGRDFNFFKLDYEPDWEWEEENKLRGVLRRTWDRFARSKSQYQPVPYNRLPQDVLQRLEKVLAWLLPDPLPEEEEKLQALVNMGGSPTRHRKGGAPSAFNDWFEEGEEADFTNITGNSTLLVTGKRQLATSDGRHYEQTFHLSTSVTGEQIEVELSKGVG